jgi:hypothetical protein
MNGSSRPARRRKASSTRDFAERGLRIAAFSREEVGCRGTERDVLNFGAKCLKQ